MTLLVLIEILHKEKGDSKCILVILVTAFCLRSEVACSNVSIVSV